MKFLKHCLLVIFVGYCGLAQAHVGSPDVSYQGKAGNYSILVNISPTDVIPGISTASIYIDNYHGEKVYLQTQYYSIGKSGSVEPEQATPVAGAPGWFSGSTWFTISGPADLNVTIIGSKGKGSVNIPVMSVDTANRRMPLILGIALGLLSITLFVLMITIVSASVSDALAKPGETPKNVRGKKFIARFITIIILLAILAATAWWCRDERGRYLAYLYKPIKGNTSVFKYNGHTVLRLGADSDALKLTHQSLSYVVPDHGKLMHLALVRVKTLDAFAHLHPIRQDSSNYLVNLPPLPPGKYFMYGDVVGYNGFEETIIDTVNLTANPAANTAGLNNINIPTSADDAWLFSTPVTTNSNKQVAVCGTQGVSCKTEDGSSVIWSHNPAKPIKTGQITSLSFCVLDADGKSPDLQPYMGMTGHAIVVKYDGSVYAHLHPIGNFAMASQQVMNKRMDVAGTKNYLPDPKKFRDSIDRLVARIDSMTEQQRNAYLMADMGMDKSTNMGGMDMSKKSDMSGMNMPAANAAKCGSVVQFPYTFPSSGMYRIWVEVKVKGKILTSFFDISVVN